MVGKDLSNLSEIYLSINEAVGRDEMISSNILRSKMSRPSTSSSPRPTTPTTRQITPTTRPTGPVAQVPRQSGGGVLGQLDSLARKTAGEIGGRIGEREGRRRTGNLPILGDIGGALGRRQGTQQGQQTYDRLKNTVGGLLKQDYEYDNFDIILEYLVAEGYADTNENALVIMANMSEEWKQTILEYSQTELGSLSQSINQNTRNAPIRKQQPGFQPSQSEPQRPSGVPIPGSSRVFNTVKKVGQAAVGSVLK